MHKYFIYNINIKSINCRASLVYDEAFYYKHLVFGYIICLKLST